MENSGGGHLQDLEKMLLEARMSNAKLMEDNESYQVLLSEKTLNGDFSRTNLMNASHDASEGGGEHQLRAGSTLADELETASEDQSEDQQVRRLESDLSAAKDQNKALTVYINKIISRILANEQFEQLFENGSLTGDTNPLAAPRHNVDTSKEQKPRTSNEKDPSLLKSAEENPAAGANANAQGSGATFLQRAGSIFGGKQKTRPRPQSLRQSDGEIFANNGNKENLTVGADKPLPTTPTTLQHLTAPNEDPNTAPSLPIRRSPSNRGNRSVSGPAGSRGHRRATSEISANVMNSINKGPAEETTSLTGAMSSATMVSPRQIGSLGTALQQPPPLILEGNERDQQNGRESDATQVPSVTDSGYGDSMHSPPDAPSSPRSAAAAALEGKPLPRPENERHVSNVSGASNTSGEGGNRLFAGASNSAKATQNKMRPLRLVQEKAEADEAALAEKKKSNRSSFMGWFNRGSQPAPGTQQPQQQVPQAVTGIARQDSMESRPSSGGKQEGL